jgi:AraC-like DNA-binding protein
MPQIAAMMGINPRTLRRRLATEGLTFEQVKDEVRFGAARELLEVTDLAIGDVASALSFATHSAFVHAFRRWSGTTPTAFRAAASGTTPARIAESLASV